jgi:hypothetical protein
MRDVDNNGNIGDGGKSELSSVPLRRKLIFWLLLTAISGLLVEVGTTSSPWLFFSVWGVLVTCPLYGLHILVLAPIAFLAPRVRLPLLFVCGAILGLYEAYITKVLWAPIWGPTNGPQLAGVHLFQTAILVLMAHPFLAFVIPLAAAEMYFTSSMEITEGAPGPLRAILASAKGRRYAALGLAVCLGAYHALTPSGPVLGGLGALANTLVAVAIAIWWRRLYPFSPPTLRQLLPDRRQFVVLAGLLFLLYMPGALLLRPKALPHTPAPHMVILCLYAILIALLCLNLRAGRSAAPLEQPAPTAYADTGPLKVFLVAFPVASALFTLLRPVSLLIIVALWIGGCGFGAALLLAACRDGLAALSVPRRQREARRVDSDT